MIAVALTTEGRREIVLYISTSIRVVLADVDEGPDQGLLISDAYDGRHHTITRVLSTTW
jgi:hypothetical protein